MTRNRNILVALLAIGLLSGCNDGAKQSTTIQKQKYNLDKKLEDEIGYTQAVKVGNTLYISGTVGWGDMPSALQHAYSEIGKTLQHYNATFANVVKENLHTTALDSVIKYKDIRKKFYTNDFPAATWDEVKRLYDPGLVVEIEVIAVLPE